MSRLIYQCYYSSIILIPLLAVSFIEYHHSRNRPESNAVIGYRRNCAVFSMQWLISRS